MLKEEDETISRVAKKNRRSKATVRRDGQPVAPALSRAQVYDVDAALPDAVIVARRNGYLISSFDALGENEVACRWKHCLRRDMVG